MVYAVVVLALVVVVLAALFLVEFRLRTLGPHLFQPVEALRSSLEKSLQQVDGKIAELERARTSAYSSLSEQVRALAEGQQLLRQETGTLVKALRQPVVRGRWGEMQLRRVVELAGMLERCDFDTQVQAGAQRPDLIVRLPGKKHIVVDAKAPLAAYLDALDAPNDGERKRLLGEHARQVRAHIQLLSRKNYWEQFQPTPELVVLFLPGENFFSAALEADPTLLDIPPEDRVVVATPTTLIALLRAVAYGWQQEAVAENARAVGELGRELGKRFATVFERMSEIGRALAGAVKAYNAVTTSVEARLLPQLRRFSELGVTMPEPALLPRLEGPTDPGWSPPAVAADEGANLP